MSRRDVPAHTHQVRPTAPGPGVEPGDASIDPEATLSISDLQERTGVPAATLRSWEQRLGFLIPARSVGGQRRYRERDADLVRRVQAERDNGLSLTAAVNAVRRERSVGTDSLFAQMRDAHPQLDVLSVSDRTMRNLTWAIEDECLTHASHPLVLGCFQDQPSFLRSGARWRELSRLARRAVALSDFPVTDARSTPERVALPPDSPMLNEWSLICSDVQLSVLLVAWERPPRAPGDPRRFECLLSLDPAVVRDAAARTLAVARTHGLGVGTTPGTESATGATEDPRRVASLLRRFAVYADS